MTLCLITVRTNKVIAFVYYSPEAIRYRDFRFLHVPMSSVYSKGFFTFFKPKGSGAPF